MALADDIKAIFTPDMTDPDFVDGLTKAIKDFVKNELTLKIDSAQGAVAGGDFSGSGSSGLEIDGSELHDAIEQACVDMKSVTEGGNTILIQGICDGLDNDPPEFAITLNGTLTPPPPASPSPMSGPATCSAVFVSDPVKTAIEQIMPTMDDMTAGGDDLFAQTIATAVEGYYTAGVCTIAGTGNLAGVSGTGQIQKQ
jgi:hypothetical protein